MAGLKDMKGKAAAGQPAAAEPAHEPAHEPQQHNPGEREAVSAASTPTPAAPSVEQSTGAAGHRPPAALVVRALVTRRRAGQAWAAGDCVEFAAGALTPMQEAQLRADPGFCVTAVDDADGPPA